MREIPLTRGQVALVDDEDYERVAQKPWHARPNRGGGFYAQHSPSHRGNKIYLHRFILQAPPDMHVDHADGNGLNNCRANLRLATRAQNSANRRGRGNSLFRGVTLHRNGVSWQVRITVERRRLYLGTHHDPISAARAYDGAALQFHGKFACLNFPDGSTPPSIDAVREDHASAEGHSV